jgi:hypothetical protein
MLFSWTTFVNNKATLNKRVLNTYLCTPVKVNWSKKLCLYTELFTGILHEFLWYVQKCIDYDVILVVRSSTCTAATWHRQQWWLIDGSSGWQQWPIKMDQADSSNNKGVSPWTQGQVKYNRSKLKWTTSQVTKTMISIKCVDKDGVN